MQLLQALFMLIRAVVAVLLSIAAVVAVCAGLFLALKGIDDPYWVAWVALLPQSGVVLLVAIGIGAIARDISFFVAPSEWRSKMW